MITATTTRSSTTAGSRRRNRRAQNANKSIRSVDSTSVSSSDVIRKPESAKNRSTPKNPPGNLPAWKNKTAMTARPRSPSSAVI